MKVHSIRSRRLFVDGAIRPGVVRWQGEKITRVDELDSEADIDVGERVVMPGIVDTHVHINEPGRTEWEGFLTATRAAAAGGVTTVVDMPLNCIPVTTTADALNQKREATRDKLHVDLGFWGGVVPHHLGELPVLCRAGILGAKAFLCDSGIDEFPQSDAGTLQSAMKVLAEHDLPLLAHAELVSPVPKNEELATQRDEPSETKRSCATGTRDATRTRGEEPTTRYESYLHSRPPKWEVDAIELLIRLSEQTGCRVHIVHLSAATALPILQDARERGVPITVETCPHYLCLEAEAIADGATAYKCAPPIREKENRDALWRGLRDGVIDFVVTDHSPCTPELKRFETGDFLEAWGGIASLQFGLRTLWTEADARGVALAQLCGWLTSAPADFAGLDHKGRLRPGADADIVVWDPDQTQILGADEVLFRHAVSPYLGAEVRGTVENVYLRGEPIFEKGSGLCQQRGKHLLRE